MTSKLKALAELYPFAFNYTSKNGPELKEGCLFKQLDTARKQLLARRSEETKRAHNIEG